MLVCDQIKQQAVIRDVIWCLSHYPVVIRQAIRDCLFEGDDIYDELSAIADCIEHQIQKLKEIMK